MEKNSKYTKNRLERSLNWRKEFESWLQDLEKRNNRAAKVQLKELRHIIAIADESPGDALRHVIYSKKDVKNASSGDKLALNRLYTSVLWYWVTPSKS